MTTNLSACFNGVLKNAYFLPITILVQLAFFYPISYFDGHHAQIVDALEEVERFTPFVMDRIIANQFKATSHSVTSFDRASSVFQVQTALRGPYINIGNNT